MARRHTLPRRHRAIVGRTSKTVILAAALLVVSAQAGAGPPSKLVFTTPPHTLGAGWCSSLTIIQSQDAAGNPADVASATTVALTTTSSGGTFHWDAACSVTITSVTIPANANTANFYYKDSNPGMPLLTASSPPLIQASQWATILCSCPATKLVFVTAPQTLTAGSCSAVVTVQGQDEFDNPAIVFTATTVRLRSTSVQGTFYADSACTRAVTDVIIPTGASTESFYFKDTKAGSPTITASEPFMHGAAQTEIINPGAASKLTFVTPALSIVAGSCSAAMTVEPQDVFGNTSPAQTSTLVNLGTSSVVGAFHSDASCSMPITSVAIAGGQQQANFYYRDTKAGSPTLTAWATGLWPATQFERVYAAGAVKMAFSEGPARVPLSACSSITTVEARDSFENAAAVVSNAPVILQSTATMTFYGDPNCGQAFADLTLEQGQTSASFYFRDVAIGTRTILADASTSGLGQATHQVEIQNGNLPVKLAFVTPPRSIEAGFCSAALEVHSQDGADRASAVKTANRISLWSTSTTTGFYQDVSCSAQITTLTLAVEEYRVTFYFKDGVFGRPTLTVTAEGLGSATQTQNVVCPSLVDGALCDDSNLCNGRETCQGGTCRGGPPPDCDDGNSCTEDSCVPEAGCQHAAIAGCVEGDSALAGCGCVAAGAAPELALSASLGWGLLRRRRRPPPVLAA